MRSIAQGFTEAGIAFHPIVESDAPWSGQLVAIGVVPVQDRSQIKKIVSRLPLYGKQKEPLGVVSVT